MISNFFDCKFPYETKTTRFIAFHLLFHLEHKTDSVCGVKCNFQILFFRKNLNFVEK